MDHSLWAFLGVAAIVIVIPGPDTALTIRNSLGGGRLGGVATALGVVCGQIAWELATSAGLVAILLASERVFHAIKLAGAVYLALLGAQALYTAWRERGHRDDDVGSGPPGARDPWRAFQQGLLSNLGNPKMAAFFAGIFPQFAPHGHATFGGLMTLGLIFSAMTLAWLALYAFAVDRAAAWFRRPRVRRGIETASGVALLGLGARLALEKD
jgi:threonine/homoserine/homoserine lactone efflux protein